MELLERYLQAIGEHLPAKGRQDTLAELRANLLAEIDEREESEGRPLGDEEVASVLEAHGMPLMVAARYRPQRALIGPEMFPIYWYTLKKSFPWVALVYAIVQCVRFAIEREPLSKIPDAVWHFWSVALTFWAIATLGFALFDYIQQNYGDKTQCPHWSVRDLPKTQKVQQEKRPSLASGIADLIVSVLGVGWFLLVPAHPFLMFGPGVMAVHQMSFTMTPEWRIAYWEIIGLLVAMWPLKVMMMMPQLTYWRRALSMGVHLLGILVLVVIVTMPSFLVPAAALSAEQMKDLDAINRGLHIAFTITLAITLVKFIWSLGKWIIDESRGKQVGHVAML